MLVNPTEVEDMQVDLNGSMQQRKKVRADVAFLAVDGMVSEIGFSKRQFPDTLQRLSRKP